MRIRVLKAALAAAVVAAGMSPAIPVSSVAQELAVTEGISPEGTAENGPGAAVEYPPALLGSVADLQEAYIAVLVRPLRLAAGDDQVLDAGDIASVRAQARERERASQVRSTILKLLAYDKNADAVATRDEIAPDSGHANNRHRKREEEAMLAMDTNGDDRVTVKEAVRAALAAADEAARGDRQAAHLEALLELDPNRDGRLTVAELKTLGLAVFGAFDTDGNGKLSEEEREALHRAQRKTRHAGRSARAIRECNLPPADKDAEIVLIGAYKAGAISSVTVAGQDKVTETVHLRIEAGKRPLYLAAASQSTVIWRLSGNTRRVAHFVTMPPRGHKGKAGVGVVGLPKRRVTLLPAGSCFDYFTSAEESRARNARATVEARLKRPVDRLIAKHMIMEVTLPSGEFTPLPHSSLRGALVITKHGSYILSRDGPVPVEKTREGLKPPPGVDVETFAEFYRDYPGGVVEINARRVVVSGRAERYQVLPRMAGLIHLMKEGRIRRTSDGAYVIQKPIKRYPPGLSGVRFRLAKGVPEPGGSPGRDSCVFSEETGETLAGEGCRDLRRTVEQ